MSDKKISQLTAATTADGTEPLPIVQSGETKKATGKVVVSGAVSDLAQTWNAAGTTFTGLKLNVTDTASASGSLLADLQNGGISRFSVNKVGIVTATNTIVTAAGFQLSGSAVTGVINWGGGLQLWYDTSDTLAQRRSTNAQTFRLYNTFTDANTFERGKFAWSSNVLQIGTEKGSSGGTARNLELQTDGTTRATLDTSGNLGLGVTPSAWTSTYKVFDFGGSAIYGRSSATDIFFTSNAVVGNSGTTYSLSAGASYYTQQNGSHFFYTAPSGTAGNAVTFTERVRFGSTALLINNANEDYDTRIAGDTDANLFFVDASTDRVGIGTNAPSQKLDVVGAGSGVGSFTTSSSAYPIKLVGSTTTNPVYLGANGNNFDVYVNGSSRLFLDISGNLGVGTSTFGTSAAGVFAVKNGTAPTTGPADTVQIYSSDVSAGNTTLSIYTEGTPVSDSTDNAVTKKIAVRINGTLYYLLADTDNS